jgi:chromate reductase
MRDIALLIGSLRKASWTRKIANVLRELGPAAGLALDEVPIGNLPFYNQDLDAENTPAPEWVAFRDRIRRADGVLFATPEYNRSVPGVLKNAVDVGSRPYGKNAWAGKPAAIVSVTPGGLGAFGANHHLRQSLVFVDMPAMPQPEAYIANVSKAFDAQGMLAEDQRTFLQTFVEAYARWVDRFAHDAAHRSAA